MDSALVSPGVVVRLEETQHPLLGQKLCSHQLGLGFGLRAGHWMTAGLEKLKNEYHPF